MRKKTMLLLLALLWLLCACGAPGTGESGGGGTGEGYHFIFVCPIVENEYWKECIEGVRRADAELGTTTTVVGPRTADSFATEIVGYMEQAVAEKPDGIMAYLGIEGMWPFIGQASAQGIPVLAIDSDAPDTSRVAYVGSDDYNLGYKAGETLVDLTSGSAKVGVLVSTLSAAKEALVLSAFRDAVNDYDIEIVAVDEGMADPDISEEKTREMLAAHPEITAMFNTAGYNVTGAARAKQALGLDELVLVGFDDVSENLDYVRDGVIDALLVQAPGQMGYRGVYLLKEYMDNGRLNRESYDTGSILVTRHNVDTYSLSSQTGVDVSKTVRVGYYAGDEAFQDGFTDQERKSGYAYEYYQAVAALAGWKYEYVYGSRSEITELLIAGDVDIMAGVYQTDANSDRMLFSSQDIGLDGSPRYFAVNLARTDLLVELNAAMESLEQTSPDLIFALRQKYYAQSSSQSFTDLELRYLANMESLRFGYVRHNLPLSEQGEDGQPTGYVKDLMDTVVSFTHVPLQPVCYETVADMEEGLSAGEIDVAFPIYSDLWLSEAKGFRQTTSFVSDRAMIIFSGDYSDDLMDRIALSETGVGQRHYLAQYYPQAQVVFYQDRAAALDAILKGDERCIVGCSSIFQRFLSENSQYQKLNVAYLDTSEDFGMAVSRDSNILAGILNKIISHMDAASVTSAMMKYAGTNSAPTVTEILQYYAVYIVSILCLFFAVLLVVFIRYRRQVHIFNKEQAKSRAALEEALQAAKLASESKTTFLSSMSHDIRTPMNAIVGMTGIAQRHIGDRGKVEDCLDKITLASRHLLTLINDVLDISKIESGKLTLNPVKFSLRDSVSSLVNIVRPMVREKDLDFDVHIRDISCEIVRADEVRLNQVFINLLTNAVKYTPERGRVVMELSEQLLPDGQTVRLTYVVRDTGIGMSEEFMANMYEVFTRAADTRTTKIQGTGLGLAIVKRVVDLMGGTIACKSTEGKGTEFTVTVDVGAVEEETLPPLTGVSVLLVDDDPVFLETAADAIRDIGVQVDAAPGGGQAVDIVRERHEAGQDYSVLIVNWRMPGMNGAETIRAVQNIMGDGIHCILISAYDWSDIEGELGDCRADGFISKPLFRSYIYDKLCEVLHLSSGSDDGETTAESDLKGLHLLVAEDNDLNWEVISELLEVYGITADRAENGRQAVDTLSAAPPDKYDAVLMDVQMPVMNGWEATRCIRADRREYLRTIPIIAMTADAFAEDIATSLDAGMNSHVSKPVDMAVLLQTLRKFTHR